MSEPTFEQSLAELEQIVQQLERGDVPLEEALTAFQTGIALSKKCKDQLNNAENTLAKMMNDQDEELPFEGAEGDANY